VPNRHGGSADYRYGFNNKEKDEEVKGNGNSYDFGARTYDPRIGRWFARDVLEKSYPEISPYAFVLNTPIRAKDPDGNLVIFINGQHDGTGGTSKYWDGYDTKVKKRLGDKNSRYVDGAVGGWANTGVNFLKGNLGVGGAIQVVKHSNVNMKVRIAAGKAQGLIDAPDIIASLQDGETIKIVTHSMGTGFSRGYTEGIMKYAKKHHLESKVKFVYELDVNSFEGASLPADKNVQKTQNKTGGMDGGDIGPWLMDKIIKSVPTVGPVPNAENTTDKTDANKGHDIGPMSTSKIPTDLGNGGAESTVEEGNNNKQKTQK
jgi:RHS repeat-associated protein